MAAGRVTDHCDAAEVQISSLSHDAPEMFDAPDHILECSWPSATRRTQATVLHVPDGKATTYVHREILTRQCSSDALHRLTTTTSRYSPAKIDSADGFCTLSETILFSDKRVERATSNIRPVTKNRILETLPRQDREHLLSACERVELKSGAVLREPGQRIRHVYFPAGSSISLIALTAAGSLEVAVIGDEGVLGVSVAFGISKGAQRVLVNRAGMAWRISTPLFCREFEGNPRLRRLLSRYIYVVIAQLSQTAVCTAFHDLPARLARWLLVTGDRAQSDQFYATHKVISAMLGVRREGVSQAASFLRQRKLIRYARGHLTILDRRGLQAAACECYLPGRNAYLLRYPGITPH